MRQAWRWTVVVAALTLVAAGCGGSHPSAASSSPAPSTDPLDNCIGAVEAYYDPHLADLEENDAADANADDQQALDKFGVYGPIFRALISQQSTYELQHLHAGDRVPYNGEIQELTASCEKWVPSSP